MSAEAPTEDVGIETEEGNPPTPGVGLVSAQDLEDEMLEMGPVTSTVIQAPVENAENELVPTNPATPGKFLESSPVNFDILPVVSPTAISGDMSEEQMDDALQCIVNDAQKRMSGNNVIHN